MRDRKLKLLPASLYDVAAVETWLAGQAERGWLPVSVGPWTAKMERGAPAACQYRLEPVDGAALIQDEALRDYYAEAGWEFVCFSRNRDFRVWRSTRPDPVELHGDPEVEAGAYRRLARRLYRDCAWTALWVLGYLCVLYPWPSGLQGALERQICEVPGTFLPLALLVLGSLLIRSLASVRAVWRLRKGLRLGIPLNHAKRPGTGWLWVRRIVLAAEAALLAASVLWPSPQVEPLQADVPPVLLSAELGAEGTGRDGFIMTGQSLLAGRMVWSVETAGSIADTVTETRYYSLRLPFLAGPLLAERAEGWDLSAGDQLEDTRFDELYFRRRGDAQYLVLRRGGQVLYVFADVSDNLTDHLDDYAAALAACR